MPADTGWAPTFETWIEKTLQEKGVPGASVALFRDGEAVYTRGFGRRDRERGRQATEQTVFGTGSVTKSFTALAVMQLVEAGRLSVDEAATRYLPELALPDAQPAAGITIHHLLTHTSGLPPMPSRYYAMLAEMELDEHERERLAELLAGLPPRGPIHSYDDLITFLGEHRYRLHGEPGQRLSYSNEGYALLGAIVERVSGHRYEDYVEQHILRPIGMTRSTFSLARLQDMDDVTAVYARHEGETYNSPGWFHARAIIPTGQLRSTGLDLIRYLEMYRNGGRAGGRQILSPAGIAQMVAGHARIDRKRRYGYGWIVTDDYYGLRAVEHSGGHKGVSAHIGFIPERGLSCAVLTNLAEAPADTIWSRCVNAFLGLPLERSRPALATHDLPAARLATFAGVYRSEEGTRVTVTVEDGRPAVSTADGHFPARPVGEDALAIVVDGQERELVFLRGERDEPTYVFSGLRLIPREAVERGQ